MRRKARPGTDRTDGLPAEVVMRLPSFLGEPDLGPFVPGLTRARLRRTAWICALAAIACGPGIDEAEEAPPAFPADQQIRTADPYARGYTNDDFPRIQEVAPGVYTYEQLRSAGDEWFTTVSMFVVTDEGVLVADGQGSAEETTRMIARIATVTDQPITRVVVASDHGDHTAGNAAFPEGVDFVAHPTSAAALERSVDIPNATTLVQDSLSVLMGNTEIRVLFLGRAHTGGDLVVYLPVERVLFMSEAFLHRVFPAMRSAFPSEWVEMIERAQGLDVDVFLPGHGFVDHPEILAEELELFQGAIRIVIDAATRSHEDGFSVEYAQAQADFGAIQDWSLRSSQGNRAIAQVYAELDGSLPPPRR